MSTSLSRITIIGDNRHLDVRLPSDEPVASLLPQLLQLMADEDGSVTSTKRTGGLQAPAASSVLTTSTGTTLEDSLSLRQSGITDGTLLYLRDDVSVPPAPEVYDVASFAADTTERTPALWSGRLRTTGLASLGGLLLAGSVIAAVMLLDGPDAGVAVAVAAALLVAGAALGRWRSVPAGLALILAGLAAAVAVALTLEPLAQAAVLSAGAVVSGLAAGAVATRRYVPFLSSAGLLAGLSGIWTLMGWSTGDVPLAAGTTGIAAVFAVGVAPRLATVLTGLSALDDDQRQGRRISRKSTLDAVRAAHSTLTGWTLAASGMAGLSAVITATAADRPAWATALAFSLLGALTLRGLSLPLLSQRAGLYLAAAGSCLGVAVALSLALRQPWLVGGVGAVALAILLASVVRVREETAARLRLTASRLELLCVLATIPLVLGLSGTYTQLGQTFG
ncbi:type VII secretion integral membrane protein EccD [Arthrobacter sp. NPDC056493]|uniref:type VII secretion integral membrane protein EccD n=1 Tax=Arthrobacter sp. NPDC056493 TaxID=3345839 RepID=UPI00366F627A